MFKEMNPELALPPQPVTTRWTTWLKAAVYYSEHFGEVESVINTFNCEEAESIRSSKECFANDRVKNELAHTEQFYIDYFSNC